MKVKRLRLKGLGLALIGLVLLLGSSLAEAQEEAAPPVGAPLVREGLFAIKLADALELGAGGDEILAETRLGELGISPRNGWISDYPVTPDIVGEIQQAIIDAADSRRLQLSREEALDRFHDVNVQLGLGVVPYADESIRDSSSQDYPEPAVVNNYYGYYGPPVWTYYPPPPAYVYMYGWVPFPFWYCGYWFPGFYVMNDFHTRVVYGGSVVFVSNHYRDLRYRSIYVVDPVKRYHSRPVCGIYPPKHKTIVYKGNPRIARHVLNTVRPKVAHINTSGGPYSPGRTVVQRPEGKSIKRPGPDNRREPYPGRAANPQRERKGAAMSRPDRNHGVQAQPRNEGRDFRSRVIQDQGSKKVAIAPRQKRAAAVTRQAPKGPVQVQPRPSEPVYRLHGAGAPAQRGPAAPGINAQRGIMKAARPPAGPSKGQVVSRPGNIQQGRPVQAHAPAPAPRGGMSGGGGMRKGG